jgi:hypothetical protein
VRTTLLDDFSLQLLETFTSSGAYSSIFPSIGTIGQFKGVVPSYAMIESSPTLTKTKRVVEVIWYLHLKVRCFYFKN